MRVVLITLTLLIAGCASNSISLTQWWSRTTLLDPNGNIYEGKAIFHWTYHDGTIEIPNSEYGPLNGRFSTQTPSARSSGAGVAAAVSGADTIVVPAISSQSIELGNSKGTAYLAHDGKVVLQCNIGVDFKTQGMGDAQMIGGGVCADAERKVWKIMFGR